eukprot:CAMPEP_0114659408 /NCGR_PEP_ID=MMETSP0191-20121206/17768_1 /TAXON_ID=126664 /ORGANISM="Sorites sp." /LENGTH=57 /DNA_ID=CAMNT_0001884501 /DNA_START=795 /DNA_END=965 /DNA_ORIENTATION=-
MTNIRSERDGLLQDLDDLRNEAIKYDKSGELQGYTNVDDGTPKPSTSNNIDSPLLSK